MGAKTDRVKEGVGGLTDNKRLKDKGRRLGSGHSQEEGRPRHRQGHEDPQL